MILVDTSIWIDHLHHTDPAMLDLLRHQEVLMHPFVLGEVALGSLRHREAALAEMRQLRFVGKADDDEVVRLIGTEHINGTGVGYVDVHLVAACLVTPGTYLWTRDRKLAALAERLDVGAGD